MIHIAEFISLSLSLPPSLSLFSPGRDPEFNIAAIPTHTSTSKAKPARQQSYTHASTPVTPARLYISSGRRQTNPRAARSSVGGIQNRHHS